MSVNTQIMDNLVIKVLYINSLAIIDIRCILTRRIFFLKNIEQMHPIFLFLKQHKIFFHHYPTIPAI